MDVVFAIVAFVAFSLIGDWLEGKKKKRRQKEMPPHSEPEQQPTPEMKQGQRQKQTIDIPPIKGAPRQMPDAPRPAERKNPENSMVLSKYAAALHAQQKKQHEETPPPSVTEKRPLQSTDIHTDVLLNAIAYAQILQPPKAYQYMATRSCRGDWNNQK